MNRTDNFKEGYVRGGRTPECGCSIEGRCARHQAMMKAIRRAWCNGTPKLCAAIYARSDGYGEVGRIPPQGYDWSGIRDSSVAAVESMYELAED